ncbi:MAG: FUSC family protein [Terriglobales bacterium]
MASAGILPGIYRDSVLDAVRTTVAAMIALFLARLLKMPESYWAPISTIVIVQSTIHPLTLGWQRFVGTALGAVLGAAFATFVKPSVVVYGLGILLCGLLAFLLRVGAAYRFAGITLSIVLLIPHASAPWIVGLHRFLEVSLGIAVALAVTMLWPRSQGPARRSKAPSRHKFS